MTVDLDVGAIPLRIVVHGASGAGKSTTAKRLAARLDEDVTSYEDSDGRTVLFDWVEHVGGNVDGRRIRTQIVTVPGHLADRSLHIVELADVVLFVVDTTAAGISASTTAWNLFMAWRSGRSHPPVVIQLNKRDDPTALSVDLVADVLGLDGTETVIETSAVEGDGITMAFVWAVRTGLRARQDGAADRDANAIHDQVADTIDLLKHLQRRERDAAKAPLPHRLDAARRGDGPRPTPRPATSTTPADPEPPPAPQADATTVPVAAPPEAGPSDVDEAEVVPSPTRRRWFSRRRSSST